MFVEITDRAKIEQLEEAGLLWYDCLPYEPADDYPRPWWGTHPSALWHIEPERIDWGYKFFILTEE